MQKTDIFFANVLQIKNNALLLCASLEDTSNPMVGWMSNKPEKLQSRLVHICGRRMFF